MWAKCLYIITTFSMLMGTNIGVHYPKSLAATVRFWCAPSSDFLSISEWMADDVTRCELDRGRLSIKTCLFMRRANSPLASCSSWHFYVGSLASITTDVLCINCCYDASAIVAWHYRQWTINVHAFSLQKDVSELWRCSLYFFAFLYFALMSSVSGCHVCAASLHSSAL